MHPASVDVPRVLERLGVSGELKGTRLWAPCPSPDHEDRHPSWFVRVDGERAGQHTCFSCKYGGDLYKLVQTVNGCSFKDAVEFVRGTKPRPPPERVRFVSRPVDALAFSLPPEVILDPFDDWIELARDYALSRGIDREQATRWRLGYAVDGRLAGRIVFPVWDGARPLSYTARTFVADEKRYLAASSKERPDPDAVFGEERWPALPKRRAVVVFEGAINGLAVERVLPDLPFAALGGSNLSAGVTMKLATFRRVFVLTDSDAAGERAAHKIRMALARHAVVSRVPLPAGRDPADLAKEAPALLKMLLARLATAV